MALEVDGKTIETDENGYLVNADDWSEAVALAIAEADKLEMTDQHWDVVHYVRERHAENPGEEANEREIMKEMGKKWGTKPTSKDMYLLFPGMPSKQGRKIGGLPPSTRKGGY